MNFFLVLAGGGRGFRVSSLIPKQFIKINDKTILENTLFQFYKLKFFHKYIVTLPNEYLNKHLNENGIFFIKGGNTRGESVSNALKFLSKYAKSNDRVFIHDAVRPLISQKLILKLKKESLKSKAIIPAIKINDTIKDINNNRIINRESLRAIQTPQVFSFVDIFKAYKLAKKDKFETTDDAQIFEKYIGPVKLIEGEKLNLKITDDFDLKYYKSIIHSDSFKVGFGYDVHPLTTNRKIILLGEKIPFNKGLLGHSDADVATHALMDAILGAMGKGDIGMLFPNTDKKYKGISSLKLLLIVKDLMEKENFKIENIDITIVAENPKISPYRNRMKVNIAKILKINLDKINIKATTTEGLGFEGEGKGISSYAIALLSRK